MAGDETAGQDQENRPAGQQFRKTMEQRRIRVTASHAQRTLATFCCVSGRGRAPVGRSIPTTSIAPLRSRTVTTTGLSQFAWVAWTVLIDAIAYRHPASSAGPHAPSGMASRGLPRSISSPTARSAPVVLSSADQRTL